HPRKIDFSTLTAWNVDRVLANSCDCFSSDARYFKRVAVKMNRVIVPALVLHHHPVTSTGSHHQRINIRPGFAVDRPTIKSSAATWDFLEDEVEALVRFRNRSARAKDSVVPSTRRRLRPLGLAALVRVFDHNTH